MSTERIPADGLKAKLGDTVNGVRQLEIDLDGACHGKITLGGQPFPVTHMTIEIVPGKPPLITASFHVWQPPRFQKREDK